MPAASLSAIIISSQWKPDYRQIAFFVYWYLEFIGKLCGSCYRLIKGPVCEI